MIFWENVGISANLGVRKLLAGIGKLFELGRLDFYNVLDMKMKIFGCWKEYYSWPANPKSIYDEDIQPLGTLEVEKRVVDYLKSGIWIIGDRGPNKECVFTNDDAGPFMIYTDGEIAWTHQCIFYLGRGQLNQDKSLLDHIRSKSYKCPTRDEIGMDRLIEIADLFQYKESLTYV